MITVEIKKIIFNMGKEFSCKDLFEKCAVQGITNKNLIINTLDSLLEVGVVNYANLKIESPTYKTIFN